jgi:sulfatase maturation enzyme AslB (radical SAM superfamily)
VNEKIYDKANSILELRGINKEKERILKEIKEQKDSLVVKEDPILQQALEDLFSTTIKNSTCKKEFYLRDHVVEEMSKLDKSDYLRYLRYRYVYDVYSVIHKTTEYPPVVQIEPTSICNYRCVFCYQTDARLTDKKNGHMGVMSLNLFKNVIDQLEGNVEGITLASRGEPTINKKLPEFLSYMSGKFLATKLNTNAYFLNEKMIHSILETDLQTLVFSADAVAEPLYSKLRVNGSLEKVLGNIDKFHQIKEQQYPNSKIITRVSGVRYSDQQDIVEMENFWQKYVDQVALVDYNPWENVYDAKKKHIITPCSDLWRRMFIWWDGRVAPCDVDYLTTLSEESIFDTKLKDVWNGGMYSALRKQHIAGKRQSLEPCSRCVVI